MLIIRRKQGEAILIDLGQGRQVRVVVAESGSAVALGVEAPREVAVWREEIARQVAEANQEAKRTSSEAVRDLLNRGLPGSEALGRGLDGCRW
ncbi:MAG: carbon storage regulator [Bacillota bacterium]|nr:carbon storage regulator [Bacillota bacterium]